jgi:ferredoxin-NADP reductase
VLTYTPHAPEGWAGHSGRIDAELIASQGDLSASTVFICGSNGFVEAASTLALEAGADPSQVLTERFGPTG